MIISLNWLKYWCEKGGIELDTSTDRLAELIGARLVEVEETIDISDKYRGIKIVEVRETEKIAGSDHLLKCMIWDGKNKIQVVCGAPNVRTGMLAVWLPPGVTLPETYDSEPLILAKRKIMGVESNGMLAAMDELDLGTDHAGIVELNPNDAKPGDDFAKIFKLDDTLLDIENKSLTHRPDCFGVIGFAREVAGILGQKFETPSWLTKSLDSPIKSANDEVKLDVEIPDAKLCPRYEAVVLDLPEKGKRPANTLLPMQTFIARSGMRSIDRVVDITNELMLLTGQPLHAFDYDKLTAVGCHPELVSGSNQLSRKNKSRMDSGSKSGMTITTPKIIVRAAREGEKLELLDGKTITMAAGDIVITCNDIPVALAGAMGGANTAIDKNTKRIVIESATFNLYNLRGTQFRHGIFSEAITRFTKGQPPALTDFVIRKAIDVYAEYCGARQVSDIVDAYPTQVKSNVVKITTEQVNDLLGSELTFDDIITTLENVGFKVTLSSSDQIRGSRNKKLDSRVKHENDGGYLRITVPWWRTDIEIPEDVIEEIGRLNGFDNIPAVLPKRGFDSPTPDKLGDFKSKIRRILSDAGANEILTYSFVSERLLQNVGQDPENSYKIINSISPDLQYVRQSLTPSILEKVYRNVKVPYDHFALFEINQVYQKAYGLTDEKVPTLRNKVALVLTNRKQTGDAYYEALAFAKQVFTKLNINIDIVPLTNGRASNAPFEPKRSAQIKTLDHKTCFGVVGEYRHQVLKNMKLPEYTAGFEFYIEELLTCQKQPAAKSLIDNPVSQDLTFRVDFNLEYAKVENLIRKILTEQKLWFELAPISIYQGNDKETKNISFKLTFASYEKTLTGAEITGIMDDVANAVKKELKGEII